MRKKQLSVAAQRLLGGELKTLVPSLHEGGIYEETLMSSVAFTPGLIWSAEKKLRQRSGWSRLANVAGYLGMSTETLVRRNAKFRKSDQILIGRTITESRVGVEFKDDEEIISANGNGRFVRRSA